MTLEQVVWIIGGISVPALLAIVLVLFPHRIVQLQGKFYRYHYRELRRLSDEEIDTIHQLPTDRLLIGKRSSFIQVAEEHPKQLRSLIFIYRTIGIVIGALLVLTIGLLLLGFATNSF